MMSTPDNNSLPSNQDTNQFLVYVEIKPQISYSTIRDFTSWGTHFILYFLNSETHKKLNTKAATPYYHVSSSIIMVRALGSVLV